MANGFLLGTVVLAVAVTSCQGIRVSSCSKNPDSDILKIHGVNSHPNPVQVPGDLFLSGSGTLSQPISGPLNAEITISRKFGFIWIDLPCVSTSKGRLGSCTYYNVCDVLAKSNANCPRVLTESKIPCTCPFTPGTYNIPEARIPLSLDNFNIPIPTVRGEYQASIRLTNATTMEEILCFDIDVELTDPPSNQPFGSIQRLFVNLFG